MILMAIKHQVQDYDAWKSVYDSYPPTADGALFARVNRAVGDPNTVLVVAGFDSAEDARAFQTDPTLKEKMQSAGIVSVPRFEIYEQVETSQA